MPLPAELPEWSTDTNYSSGPDVGLPTRLIPTSGERASGYIRGTRPPARKLNWLIGLVCDWITHLSSERPHVQTFETAGVWNKPAWAKEITLVGFGGGAGGHYGGLSDAPGGGGGGSGHRIEITLPADQVPDEIIGTPMPGGAGGVAPAVSSGQDGGDFLFTSAETFGTGIAEAGWTIRARGGSNTGTRYFGGEGHSGGGAGGSSGEDGGHGGWGGSNGYDSVSNTGGKGFLQQLWDSVMSAAYSPLLGLPGGVGGDQSAGANGGGGGAGGWAGLDAATCPRAQDGEPSTNSSINHGKGGWGWGAGGGGGGSNAGGTGNGDGGDGVPAYGYITSR